MPNPQRESLGFKSPTKVLEYLREIGDDDAAERLQPRGGTGQAFGLSWGSEVWGHTGLLIGYIPVEPANRLAPVQNAYTLAPDPSLKGARIKITLERFWVQRYPGRGSHQILCEFTGKNQIRGEQEEMRFALTTEARDGSSAAVSGAPIFLGVTVGQNGIAFEGKTINVRSSDDEEMLTALSSGPFREGLALLTTVQPALKPFVGIAGSLVSSVLKRSKNKQIQHFKLGLDFSANQTSVALRHGSFAVIQCDDKNWNWQNIAWNVDSQQMIRRETGEPVGYNYIVLRVSPYEE
jgi:hypothetical protein